jgi:L-2-hydroxyglutarate oxidase LhgO
MDRVDAVVIGAGVVGLAAARALGLAGRQVVVVERHHHIGTETSSRNSGVIHSGIYYPKGSSKAAHCVRGRNLLYAYCEARSVAHRRCGKIIVAQEADTPKLEELQRKAIANGVSDLVWLDGRGIREIEEEVTGHAALQSPSTGIVDVHEYMLALRGDIEDAGGIVALDTRFVRARRSGGTFRVDLQCNGDDYSLETGALVNSGGLNAVRVLEAIEGYPRARIPRPHFAKGNYFDLRGRSPFSGLVYPLPSEAGLGVHATLDLGGQVRFGPDVEWLDTCAEPFDYRVDPTRGESFYEAIRQYWRGLPDGSLSASYSGIRPKLVDQHASAADFRIETSQDHGIEGLVNLLGIESPGLTSSLSIAEQVLNSLAPEGAVTNA